MIFTKEFKGVKAGDIYHTDFVPGDECPPELLDAAVICEVVEVKEPAKTEITQPEVILPEVVGDGSGEALPEISDEPQDGKPVKRTRKPKAE